MAILFAIFAGRYIYQRHRASSHFDTPARTCPWFPRFDAGSGVQAWLMKRQQNYHMVPLRPLSQDVESNFRPSVTRLASSTSPHLHRSPSSIELANTIIDASVPTNFSPLPAARRYPSDNLSLSSHTAHLGVSGQSVRSLNLNSMPTSTMQQHSGHANAVSAVPSPLQMVNQGYRSSVAYSSALSSHRSTPGSTSPPHDFTVMNK
jgi:hypothetical protein